MQMRPLHAGAHLKYRVVILARNGCVLQFYTKGTKGMQDSDMQQYCQEWKRRERGIAEGQGENISKWNADV